MESNDPKQKDKRMKKKNSKNSNIIWSVKIVIFTFITSGLMTLFTNSLSEKLNVYFAFLVLMLILLIGIIGDIIGIAVTSADEKPFHSMSARREKGSRIAVRMIKNADKVSNFCNDVIGDIASVISGSTTVIIVVYIVKAANIASDLIPSIILTSITAAITVGGKALGKSFAINEANQIVLFVAKTLEFLGYKSKSR